MIYAAVFQGFHPRWPDRARSLDAEARERTRSTSKVAGDRPIDLRKIANALAHSEQMNVTL
jgi:hypothetical protein